MEELYQTYRIKFHVKIEYGANMLTQNLHIFLCELQFIMDSIKTLQRLFQMRI